MLETTNAQEVIDLEKTPVEEVKVSEAATDEEDAGKTSVVLDDKPEKKKEDESLSPEDIVSGAKSKKGNPAVQARIDELTRQKYELKKQLEEEKTKKLEAPPAVVKNRPLPPAELEFSATEEFKKARIKYEDDVEQWRQNKIKADDYVKKQQEEIQVNIDKFNANASRVAAKYEDFSEVINAMPTSPILSQAILSSDFAPEIGYYLAKNPDLAIKLANQDVITIGREIGRLEARFGDATKRLITTAPPPLRIVDAETETQTKDDPSKMSMAEFMEWDKKIEIAKIKKKLGG